jgi:phage portal protein BeeE
MINPERALATAKLAGVVLAGYLAWRAYKGIKETATAVADLPGQAYDSAVRAVYGVIASVEQKATDVKQAVVEVAKSGGTAFQNQYKESVKPVLPSGQAYGQKYNGPLVNDDGYDFGQLSG